MKLFNNDRKGWVENADLELSAIWVAISIIGIWNVALTVLVFVR